MTHTKTIKRPDGVEWKIQVSFIRGYTYAISKYNNGDWVHTFNHPLTPAEIHAAKLEIWAKMKPML